MLTNHHEPEASTARLEKIEELKARYRDGSIWFDTFILSLTLLGMSQRDAKAEAAIIHMEKRHVTS